MKLILLILFGLRLDGRVVAANPSLFACVDDALERAVFDGLAGECRAVHAWATDPTAASGLIHNKRPTFWYELGRHAPRNYVESAIERLRGLIPDDMLKENKSAIRGAEWWVQIRGNDEGISFHYDKDEGLASLQGVMKHPAVSTVTYLSDVGAPTLIFEMITIDGNQEEPEIPDAGFLSYPKANRHVMFSGALQHGVLGSAAPPISGSRITLLINWWYDAPIEPNTVALTNQLASANKHLRALVSDSFTPPPLASATASTATISASGDSALASSSASAIFTPVHPLAVPPISSGRAVRHAVTFPPGDLHFLYLPPASEIAPANVYSLQWGSDQCYGSVGLLDLYHETQVGQLFRLPQPKLLLLYEAPDDAQYEAILSAVLPLAKELLGKIKVYLCPTTTCADVARAFGLEAKDLPIAVIDDTATGAKFVQSKSPAKGKTNGKGKRKGKGKDDWGPTRESLESFLKSSLPTLFAE